jgi:hypothetical protein
MALLQTGRTLPKGQTNLTVGNEISERQDVANDSAQLGMDLGFRGGVTDNIEVGLQGLLLAGAKANVKVAFLPRESPWAVAAIGSFGTASPVGYSSSFSSADAIIDAEAGGVVSYHGASGFVPYIGARWVNFWLINPYVAPPTDPTLMRPGIAGYGNGAFVPTIGFKIGTPRGGVYLEYQYIVPVTSDPGDGWAWTGTHLFEIVAYICASKCEL